MDKYEPLVKGCYEEWLALDESKRVILVKEFHEGVEPDIEEEAFNLHAAIHVVVENQIASGEDYVKNAASKLVRQGLDKHEAVHAIGATLGEFIHALIIGQSSEFPVRKYRTKLEKLTAKRWRKGQY